MATEHRDAKAGLRTWWQQFTTAPKTRPSPQHLHSYPHAHSRSSTLPQEYAPPPSGAVFGRPLLESLKYAHVQISTADANGKLYVWGYIPVVVAKWCVPVLIPFPSLIYIYIFLYLLFYWSRRSRAVLMSFMLGYRILLRHM